MDNRLSQIETMWSVVRRAHDDEETAARSAQQQMIDRYGPAIRRYLIAALRDPEAADEVYQEFCLKFITGKFQNANPEKGRFRNFVKTSIINLMYEHHRKGKRRREQQPIELDVDAATDEEYQNQHDAQFANVWREQVLERCWHELKEQDRHRGRDYYQILRFRVDHPEMRSGQLADSLSEHLGKPMSAGSVRVTLHRARDAFAHILMNDVRDSLTDDSLDGLEAELIDLDLHKYCKDVIGELRSNLESDS